MGTKRKIAMAKRETKSQRSVTFSKRRLGLFKKAAELSAISGAQIAVLATPPSGNPNAVYSGPFGHSYTDAVVDAFLSGRIPTAHNFLPDKNLGSGFLSENCDDELGILIEKLISDLKNSPGSGFLSENCDDPDELRIQIEKLSDLKDCVGIIQRKREEQIVSCGHNLDKDSNAKSAQFEGLCDLQDRLGLSQPSKDKLPPLQFPEGFNQLDPDLMSIDEYLSGNRSLFEDWGLGTDAQDESFDGLDITGEWIKFGEQDEDNNRDNGFGIDWNNPTMDDVSYFDSGHPLAESLHW
ncbi:PREDICTED: uncharacterized protein LOC104820129 [Tarenaya hassleriana]|uniref:uncharacterized protein LOC104820129 n=1 Tax=Tarenaya hassleriana TaxID=28532 RepID=UPI00053C1460|nr:PREDICTED: uncharacterized protein LOC104820129 [Tarenaya hassleriana]